MKGQIKQYKLKVMGAFKWKDILSKTNLSFMEQLILKD